MAPGPAQPRPAPIAPGDPAPDFTATDHTGLSFALSDYRNRSSVVLYFYPMDNTPACTAEACGFRDTHEILATAGAKVIGVSPDSDDSHRAFAKRLNLPFSLVSDSGGALRALFAVPRTLGLFPGRVTYVIDPAGIVRHVFSSQLRTKAHVAKALAIIRSFDPPPPAQAQAPAPAGP